MTYLMNILTVLFLLFTCNLLSQNQVLEIINIDSKEGIEDVVVHNKENTVFLISDANGEIVIDAKTKNSILHFQHPSYKPFSINYSEIKNLNYLIELEENSIQIDVSVISVDRNAEKKERISNKVDVIEMKTASLLNTSNSADLLETTGNIYIQKSQGGGGSPIIRGFEANKVLLVVDGVRMNNAIYRGGHLQNVITIDESMLERVEVIYGPGSLIYGSDALGGVVHFYTKKPKFSYTDKILLKTNAMMRYASVNNENTVHFDINIGANKFASLTSVSYSNFGDSKTGTNRNTNYGDWGKTLYYVENNKIIKNRYPYVQKSTAYKQFDFMQKLKYKENNFLNFELNFQYSTSSNINRYDKLQVIKNKEVTDTSGLDYISASKSNDSIFEISFPKYAEWYYGPQERLFTGLTVNFNKEVLIHDKASYIISYQRIKESRHKRKFNTSKLINNIEELSIITFNADFRKALLKKLEKKTFLLYGIELNYNKIDSRGKENDITDKSSKQIQARYPDAGSNLATYAIYTKLAHSFNKKMNLSLGLRLNHNRLKSSFSNRKFNGANFENINLINTAFSGSINYIYVPNKITQINALISTGFRAPNVDDVGKIFDPNNQEIVIPNGKLKPEYTYNFELGLVLKFENKARIDLVGYYTILDNFIQREPHHFNGEDSIYVDNDIVKSQVLANVNSGRAFMTGVSLNTKIEIFKNLNLISSLNYTYGRLENNVTPLAHIPPPFGRVSLDFKYKKLKTSLYSKFSAWKNTWEYAPLSVDNLDEATKDGTPAWATINLNLSYSFGGNINTTLGIENILDSHYRPFGSAISAKGRNFVFSIRGHF